MTKPTRTKTSHTLDTQKALFSFIVTSGILLTPHCARMTKVARCEGDSMTDFLRRLWSEQQGQDIAEYAVMLAVILVLVVGTIRLIGGNANNAFSTAASSISQ